MDSYSKYPARSPQPPTGAAGDLYKGILMFADGKQYLMRAPLRMWFGFYWKAIDGRHDKRTFKFQQALFHLEQQGYIRRFDGGIEIMENKHART